MEAADDEADAVSVGPRRALLLDAADPDRQDPGAVRNVRDIKRPDLARASGGRQDRGVPVVRVLAHVQEVALIRRGRVAVGPGVRSGRDADGLNSGTWWTGGPLRPRVQHRRRPCGSGETGELLL